MSPTSLLTKPLRFWRMQSPVGELLLLQNCERGAEGLVGIFSQGHRSPPPQSTSWIEDREVLEGAVTQLEEYFAGERQQFDLALAPVGTPFQQKVWRVLQEVPYGATTTYGAMASKLGNPNSSRAVGAANGKNPISIVIPCHRAIGRDGSLTGYAGGLAMKQQLLDLERRCCGKDLDFS